MKPVRRTLAVVLAVLVMAPVASAQNHVINKSALDQAVQVRVAQDQSDRAIITSLLARPEVREVAAQAGLSLEKASAAVSTLQGDDLRNLAGQARQVNDTLAGGASTIVISTTAIIIILLIIILLVVA
ncbi:MAG TPA: hypothetical protein VNJ03_07525 [Vicinamibacterales bacterium]|nr:hypothetical protein [Vicinamibacterales bacterium]